MGGKYEEPSEARFLQRMATTGHEVVIPARRNWFVLLFLCFWLAAWTAGGVMAVQTLRQDFDLFLVFWLGGWAVGWLFAAATIAWQLNGKETLRVVGGDLDVTHSAIGLKRSWLFRGHDIRNFQASGSPTLPFGWNGFDAPLLKWRKWGSVKFRYGARTVYLAPALDEAEGALIVESLQRSLPRTAIES